MHSKYIDDHERRLALAEQMRRDVEAHTYTRNPNRATAPEDNKDIYLFSKIVELYPTTLETQMTDFVFFLLRVDHHDVHTSIISHFGRYSYRNEFLGRLSMKKEQQYLETIDHFLEISDKKSAKNIREHIKAGR
jgi:uncharacterized protein (DUF924 family)